jgi:Phospholipase_D-nuclease N-terminal
MITILLILVGLYVLAMSVFLLSENRRPQATLAWLLVLFFAPALGADLRPGAKSNTTPMITSSAWMIALTILCRSDSVFLLGHR